MRNRNGSFHPGLSLWYQKAPLTHVHCVLLIVMSMHLGGCVVSTVVGVAVDTAIEVAKVPFKVGAAVVDVATGDDDEENAEEDAEQADSEDE